MRQLLHVSFIFPCRFIFKIKIRKTIERVKEYSSVPVNVFRILLFVVLKTFFTVVKILILHQKYVNNLIRKSVPASRNLAMLNMSFESRALCYYMYHFCTSWVLFAESNVYVLLA